MMLKLCSKVLAVLSGVLLLGATSQAQVTVIGQVPGNIQVRWGNGVTKPINNVESIQTGHIDNDTILDVVVRQGDGYVLAVHRDRTTWQCYPAIAQGISGYWPATVLLSQAHAGNTRRDVVIFGPVTWNNFQSPGEWPVMVRCNAAARTRTSAIIPGHGGPWFSGFNIIPDRTGYAIQPVWNGSYNVFNVLYNGPAFHWNGAEPGVSWNGVYRVDFANLAANRWLN